MHDPGPYVRRAWDGDTGIDRLSNMAIGLGRGDRHRRSCFDAGQC